MAKAELQAVRDTSKPRRTVLASSRRSKPFACGETCGPLPKSERDSYAVTALSDVLDRSLHAAAARLTAGLSPAALAEAYFDWATHLAFAPGKRLQLVDKAVRKMVRLANFVQRCGPTGGMSERCIEPLPQDRRFISPEWDKWPYNFISQSFLLQQQWWHNATTGIRGVTAQNERIVTFTARQLLDMFAPSNFLLTNPELLQATLKSGGANLVQGLHNFLEDWERAVSGKRPVGTENFVVGKNIAVSRGKVIFRNELIELIQYLPTTHEVRPEPVLIVPAWIMKYYILDLSPDNSMVKYLLDQGFTVFMISWRNPGPEGRDLGLDDYLKLGFMAALDTISAILPASKVHAVGYCIGGTLLAMAAATLARERDERLQSITLLAAQTDFSEAGELMLFINESQLSFLEDIMWEQGFLDAKQMAGAFQMLRSADLIWSRMVRDYLMAVRSPMTDLVAWNSDATRMPYRMHSEYLRHLFFDNDLAEGRVLVDGQAIALADIRVPIFCVGTVRDHIAPWRSTYKINLLTNSEVTYVLATGGHNVGIVSPPSPSARGFQVLTMRVDEPYVDPETYKQRALHKEGSWWIEWIGWLNGRSGPSVAPPPIGLPGADADRLQDAPGSYVLQD